MAGVPKATEIGSEGGMIAAPENTDGVPNATETEIGSGTVTVALIAMRGIDDADANVAQAEGKNTKPITAAQVKTLSDLADEVGADKAKFCRYLNVTSLAEIPASKFNDAKAALEAKRPQVAEAAE